MMHIRSTGRYIRRIWILYGGGKRMKYNVVQDIGTDDFVRHVQMLLDLGWNLYGPTVSHNGMLVQAMILEEIDNG